MRGEEEREGEEREGGGGEEERGRGKEYVENVFAAGRAVPSVINHAQASLTKLT